MGSVDSLASALIHFSFQTKAFLPPHLYFLVMFCREREREREKFHARNDVPKCIILEMKVQSTLVSARQTLL